MSSPIITSLLDTDLYKMTMQQAVLHLFPESVVTYRFKNRGDQRFNIYFVQKLQEQIQFMSQIRLSKGEYSWIKEEIPFFKSWYVEYLKNYRFNPDEVNCFVNSENDLVLTINGTWASTILWEVPLMAIISELYFQEIEPEWDYNKVFEKALNKGYELSKAGCFFSDFGTRRRRSNKAQKIVIKGLKFGARRYEQEVDNIMGTTDIYMVGTSNLYFAKEFKLRPIGTMAHEWIMGNSVLEGLYNANYFALQNWVRTYHADLGIALTDTYGFPSFLRNFSLELAKLYDGVRHDSGSPNIFAQRIIKMYEDFGIDPKSKMIVFSDGLDTYEALKIKDFCGDAIKVSFGIGTHFTNDFENSKALNMVIKLYSCGKNEEEQIPVVKLSDTPGKVMGHPDAVKVAQWLHQGKALNKEI